MLSKNLGQINTIDIRHIEIKQDDIRLHLHGTAIGLFRLGFKTEIDVLLLEVLPPIDTGSHHVINHEHFQWFIFFIQNTRRLQ
ncbi:hypothetical protein GALL_555090 [mine drainage metagenome]|uniref:Uncharacterized protein n=1 Tax=mine drainage metagenome TaxID=410659 RepID=A0A1J5PHC1_9ZZZZ